ncbi:flagellar hook-length control protein FliK [Pseudoxanthomonas daejeonensis]
MLDGGAPAGSGEAAQAPGRRAESGGRDSAQPRASKTQEAASARDVESTPAPTASAASGDALELVPADEPTTDPAAAWPPPGLASLLAPGLAPTPTPPPTTPTPTPTPTSAMAAPFPHASAASTAAMTASGGLAVGTADAAADAAATPAAADTLATLLQPVADAGADTTPNAGVSAFPLAMASPATATQASPTPPLSTPPNAPTPQLHGEAFADDVGTHVQWLAGQKIGHAHIRISPQDLGPVEIRLQLDGDRISADFSSAQPEVRQALENGLPRLREMLGQNGFQLAHAGVGQQSQQDGSGQGNGSRGGGASGGTDDGPATPPPVRQVARGLLDAYA